MLRVGLTGGLACGKTFVGEELERLGCLVVHADEIGHEVIDPGGEAHDGVLRLFGAGILDEAGGVDRQALAEKGFGDPDALARLNALVHPLVVRREEEIIAGYAAGNPSGIAVVEAAILVETGSYKRFDKLILVFCEECQQVERAMRRPGATEAGVKARLQRQMALAEKRKYADFVINTSGEKEAAIRQTREVFEALRRVES